MSSASLCHLSMDTLMRSALDGVFVIDRRRRYVLFNEVCASLTGYSLAEVSALEPCCGDLMNCRDRHNRSLKGVLCPAAAIFNGSLKSVRQRMQILRKNGTPAMIETLYSAVHNPAGTVEYVLGIMRSLADLPEDQTPAFAAPQNWCDPPLVEADQRLDKLLSKVEAAAIRRALITCGGHRHKAAEHLGISRSRLYRRMEVLQIDPDALK